MRLAARRTLLVVAFVMPSCSPLGIGADQNGTEELTAAAPSIDLSATFCMDGPELDDLRASGRVFVDARWPGDGRSQATLNVITAADTYPLVLEPGRPHENSFALAAAGPWEGQAGHRCGEPRTVRFELVEPVDSTTVEVKWRVQFGVEELKTPLWGDTLADAEASLTVDRKDGATAGPG
jgi:hypothetical protein